MANNYIDFLKGLNLVPNGSTLNSEQGDLEVTGGQLKFHDGTANRAVVVDVFTGNVDITGILTVTGQANVDNLRLDGNTLSSTDVDGDITLAPNGTGNVSLTIAAGGVVQLGSASVTVDDAGIVTITGQLNVDNLRLDGNTISSTDTDGDITLDPDGNGSVVLSVSGSGLVELGSGNISADSTGILSVVGEASIDNIKIDGNVISSTDTDGPITLTPDGVGIVEASSSVSVQGDVTIKDGNSLILADADSSNSVELKSPAAITVDYSITLPDAQGAAGEVMVNDGSGNLSWGANGAGDVVGPASSTDEAIVRFDGTTGKLLQDSSVTISDAGVVSGATQLNVDNLRLDGNVISSTDTNGNVTITPNGTGIAVSSSSLQISGQNELRLADSDSSNYVAIKSPATVATNYSIVLPSAQGASNDTLINDGSGNLSWAPGGGGGSTPTTFTIANNQSSAANVTGFLLNSANEHAFTSEYSIDRTVAGGGGGINPTINPNIDGSSFISGDPKVIKYQADGKILIGGQFTSYNGNGTGGILRLNADGTEDTAFNTNAGTGVQTGTGVWNIGLQSDGKIILIGSFDGFDGGSVRSIARLNSDGTLDTTYMSAISPGFEYSSSASDLRGIVVLSGDDVIISGAMDTFAGVSTPNSSIIKIDDTGSPISAFNTNLGTGFNDGVMCLKEQADNKILVGGYFTALNGNTRNRLVRLNSDGTEDTAFYTNLGSGFTGPSCVVRTIELLSTGDIIVGGFFSSLNSNTRDSIVGLTSSGTEISGFYSNLAGAASNAVYTISKYADDSFLVGGLFSIFGGNSTRGIAKRFSDGTEDTGFTADVGTGTSFINPIVFGSAVQDSNNSAIIVGQFVSFNGDSAQQRIVPFAGDSSVIEQGTLKGIFKDSAWQIGGASSFGDDAGVTLSITSGGQLQYTSTNISGTIVTSEMKFLITRL